MKIKLKWFVTGMQSVIDEVDELLNPKTTILEVKGLIQIRFGFIPSEVILIHQHLLENYTTLQEVGCVGKEDDPIITAHVLRQSEENDDDVGGDDALQEFSHEDFILAMQMLGKSVSVSNERIKEVREFPPRMRPVFLDLSPPLAVPKRTNTNSIPPPPPGMPGASLAQKYDPSLTQVYQIFSQARHGMRREGCDKKFSIHYPGISESFPYWDARLPDMLHYQSIPCGIGEICLELFYFGEFSAIDAPEKFLTLVQQSLLELCGMNVKTPLPMREAGCIYPLVACPIVLSELDAMELGDTLFDDFGRVNTPTNGKNREKQSNGSNNGNVCTPQ
ncbi:uncharacterized protein TM35_000431730 [Trypanosoma theileri]|uniref:Ubiquitin-like domain-containing protein n=1 Tax=Trypanosoma theileri TaxID=67003 RepID=A0A1X0NIQ0_9TRYP|nr:uncharacterized protein TM35_000431730 [Trypanosoma theileri]ORC84605.1 hypothetical protein TM35_000431730 [Trypanosoma theileri]